ncbi:MAG: hypothetical protein DME22_13370 [Verrucomicrobia bacterium]|nr:MAG: hypothetical protein DME22_13370 [Verrucomicrobiota bacterium]
MNRQPDVQLLETGLQARLETDEELPVLLRVFRVNKQAIEPVALLNFALTPDALDHLRFP